MPTRFPRVLAAALALAACGSNADPGNTAGDAAPREDLPMLGLLSSLPIYWPESASFGDILDGEGEKSWARRTIEEDFRIEPLDTIEPDSLIDLDLLVLAQPRALSAAENVALDQWVRGGGRVVVFADPMLTRHSQFAIGDRRRPQDVALLSPILARWGLELTFDERQEQGERLVAIAGGDLPVDLAGQFRTLSTSPGAACTMEGAALVARCSIGEGFALLVADAALLDDDGGDHAHGDDGEHDGSGLAPEQRAKVFSSLLTTARAR